MRHAPALVTVLVASSAAAAVPEARFRRLGPDEGLSHGHVMSILQDGQGFLWLATELGGLNRYDGGEVKAYRHDPGRTESLSHDFVWTLYEDRAGVLWAGTNGGGLERYDRAKDAFVHFRHDPDDPGSLPHDNVKSLYEDGAGRFWVGTDGGLSLMDRAAGTFVTYRRATGDPSAGLSDVSVRAIAEDAATGRLWLGTRRGGVSVLDPGTGRFTHLRHDPEDERTLASDTVTRIVAGRDGAIWLATHGGLDRFVRETGTFVHHRHDAGPESLADNVVQTILEDRSGRLWVGTVRGLGLLDGGRGTFHHYRNDPYDRESLGDDAVWSLAEDEVGALWVGGAHAGASRLGPRPPRFAVHRRRPGDDRGLSGDAVQAVDVDADGKRLWVGTTAGLNRIDATGITHYRHRPGDARGLSSDDVRALARDAAGALWIGTSGGGLLRFDGGSFTRYAHDPRDAGSLAGNSIDALHASPRGGLWVAVHGVGLDWFDGRRFVHYGPSAAAPRTLPTHYVLHVLEQPPGIVWLATHAQGLLRVDVASSTVDAYPLDASRPNSEAANRVHVIHAGRDGALWLGANAGLFRFDPQARRYTRHVDLAHGLPSRAVVAVESDGEGRLWLGTPGGLARFDPATGRVRTYDRADGLPAEVFGWRAHTRGPDGRLYFGTSQGLATFDPARLTDNPHVPAVVLTGFELFDRPVAIAAPGSPLREAIHVSREIALRHDQSSFTFRFAALDYEAPRRNRYRYRMEGFDDEWRTTDAARRSATYTNLDAGRYVFRVHGSNNDGVWNEEGAKVAVVVSPPWWGTWWFRVLALAAVAALVGAAHRVRVRTLAERERRFRTLAENAPDMVVRFDRQRRYVYANAAVGEYSGLDPSFFLGKSHRELSISSPRAQQFDAAIGEIFATGRPESIEFELRTPKGQRAFESRLVPERDARGGIASVLVITRDVTGHKVLLREIHHRVKNNLQVISSLLSLQSHHVRDEAARAVLNDSRSRVTSMALIHEKLFQSANLARVDAGEYIRSLVAAVFVSYGAGRDGLQTAVHVDDVSLGIDTAVPCGLLVNELVSNALKHAFPPGLSGTLEVELRAEGDGRFVLRVTDDGVGIPPGLDVRNPETLGLQLVTALVAQLDGKLDIRREGGTTFEVRFVEMLYRDRL